MEKTDSNAKTPMKEKIDIIAHAAKEAGILTVNSILCIILQDFERDVITKTENEDNKGLSYHVSNVFLDYILDRLGAIGICSPATDDMTAHECDNLKRIIDKLEPEHVDNIDCDDMEQDDEDSED